MKQCMYCGFSVDESMKVCPNCKAPVIHKKPADEAVAQNINRESTTADTNVPSAKKKKKKLPIIMYCPSLYGQHKKDPW